MTNKIKRRLHGKYKARNILFFIIAFILSFITPLIALPFASTSLSHITATTTLEQAERYVQQGLFKMGFVIVFSAVIIFLVGLLLKHIHFKWGFIAIICAYVMVGTLSIIFATYLIQSGTYRYEDLGTDNAFQKFLSGLFLVLLLKLAIFGGLVLIRQIIKAKMNKKKTLV